MTAFRRLCRADTPRMTHTSLTHYCEQHLDETLSLLQEMVEINSFTGNAAGVNRLGELTARAFARLGFEPTFVASSHPAYGNHLVLKRPQVSDLPTIALVSHLDTVFPEEEERRNAFHWRREGTRIHGPGTNDIKGGTVLMHLMLSALQAEAPEVFAAANWVILLNACEEESSVDFRELAKAQLPPDTLACLVFEGDGGGPGETSLVTARKGRVTFTIEVEGRGAHAGSSHKRGVNAVVELARIVTDLHQLTSYEEDLTVNVGSFYGGGPVNRVPHSAQAELEMRAFSPEAYGRVRRSILALAGEGSLRSIDADAHPSRITVTPGDETPPWPRNGFTNHLAAIWYQAGLG
ncbi:MAG: M20/M25/M40 family metallo-hydrolase, partial [Verrucomicrobiaceae bacterium]